MKKVILLVIAMVVLVGCGKYQAAVEKEVEVSGGWKKCSEFLFLSEKDGDKKKCAIADFDGDGKDDIVVYDPATAGFRIMSSK